MSFSDYKKISSKLKKRFLLRKPNLSEASEQFAELGRELNSFKEYSGYCSLAVARCENTLGNTDSELQALLSAARLFRDSDQINASVSSYRHAIKICDPSLLNFIYTELAQMYLREKRYLEAGQTFEESCLFKEAAEAYFHAEQFEMALNSMTKCSFDMLDNDDLVTIFLLKLLVYEPKTHEITFPIIADGHNDNDSITTLNILLESLYLMLKDGMPDKKAKNQLLNHLHKNVVGLQRDMLFLVQEKL